MSARLVVVLLAAAAVLTWPRARWQRDLRRGGREALHADDTKPRRFLVGRRRPAADEESLVRLVGLLAAPLRGGAPPAVALEAAESALARDIPLRPLLNELTTQARQGSDVGRVWRRHALSSGSPDLRFVGQAWELSERTGAPLAGALGCATDVLHARIRARERLSSAAAGPRASMAVLCLLPLSGPLVGLACGVTPGELYLSTWASRASLAAGVLLTVAAWWSSREILRRAR